ncbi:MAG: cytochrome c3 family protein [Ignavibacteria bacterium]|nr:cytochrome c3 family protein [Ignavibacteria bacterium]
MSVRFPKIPDSLGRLLVVFALLVGGALAVRVVIPPSMKDEEFHRNEAIEREMSRPVRYAGSGVCADCHDESVAKEAGYHENLSCETCHGSAREHSENPLEVKPTLPRLREFCSRCHTYDPSRPTGFPQINPVVHNPLKQCIACHNPHDPKPPTVPQECQACHAEIARTKAVSPHVLLECTTCHNVPRLHKVTPRAVRATIPPDRAFCGKCHGTQSTNRESPKVDLATHGEKYLCWQCHYPHMPELD